MRRILDRYGRKIGLLASLCIIALAGLSQARAGSDDDRMPLPNTNPFSVLSAALTGEPAATTATSPATAAPAATSAKPAANSKKQYFVEFRARSALSYGHTFLVHGKLNAKGEIGVVTASQVAGLHPATESPVPWMIGHVMPVISETGASDGDTEDEYLIARYRVLLTEAEYNNVAAYIAKHQKNSPMWHAVLYNCNAWVGDVAKFLGLKTPKSTMLYPEEYINGIALANGDKIQPVIRAVAQPATAKPGTAKPAAPRPASAAASAAPAAPKPAPAAGQQAAAPVPAATSTETIR